MKCLKCGMEVNENSTICPLCGSELNSIKEQNKPIKINKPIVDEDLVELPALKTDNKEQEFIEKDNEMLNSLAQKFDSDNVSLEKTRTIKPIDSNGEFSFIDDINKQIEAVNEEAKEQNDNNNDDVNTIQQVEEEIKPTVATPTIGKPVFSSAPKIEQVSGAPLENDFVAAAMKKQDETYSLDTKESVKKRTGILAITALVVVVLLVASVFVAKSLIKDKVETEDGSKQQVNNILQTYYSTQDPDDLKELLEKNLNDKDKIDEIQENVKTKTTEWLNTYFDTEYASQADFNTETTKYKELFRGLYEYAVVKDGNKYVRALEDKDYDDYIKQIDDNYNSSRIFYEALDLYNEKDYNKAYYALSQIDSNSKIYTKTRIYTDRINSNVIGILKSDISKIEQDITDLSDSDILTMYSQIEQVIIDYDRVYSSLELSKNTEYNDLLQQYKEKVAIYTSRVSN